MPIDERTAVIAVTSGKGGVGKSTVSLNLALALAARELRVGLLDADFYGPDIPLMVNLTASAPLSLWMLGRSAKHGALALEPVERFGLEIMSVGFLIGESQALSLPAPLLQSALHQLVANVAWSRLDFLIVDLPPGTADLQQELLRLVEVAGALVVVGPQDVAHLDARRVLDMLAAAGVPVIGGVENMVALVCPHCGEGVEVFPRAPEERSIWASGVARLASIPLDPFVARAGDRGAPVLASEPAGAQAASFHELAAKIVQAVDGRPSA